MRHKRLLLRLDTSVSVTKSINISILIFHKYSMAVTDVFTPYLMHILLIPFEYYISDVVP
jgi:hypothetical protein